MKKLELFKSTAMAGLAVFLFAMPVQAQEKVTEFGIFDHLSLGVTLGTTGVGLDLAAPVTDFLQVRAGYNYLSGFTYKEDIDYRAKGKKERGKTKAEAKNYMNTEYLEVMKKYNVKRCYYGHLHANSIQDAVEGDVQGINLKLVSSDGLEFKLLKI